MRYFELIEKDIRGAMSFETKYNELYHLCDYVGLTNTLKSGSLKSRSQDYISTTFDNNLRTIVGRDNLYFRFTIDANSAIRDFGGFPVVYYSTEIQNGHRRQVALGEKEVGLSTREIDIWAYCNTLSILIPINSREFAQCFLYRRNSAGRLGSELVKWYKKKPLLILDGQQFRPLNAEEHKLLSAMEKCVGRGLDYAETMISLSDEFDIRGFEGERLDSTRIRRELKARVIMDRINQRLTDRPFDNIDPSTVIDLVSHVIDVLEYGSNFKSEIMHRLREHDLLTPDVPPIAWAGFFRELINDASMESIIKMMAYMQADVTKTRHIRANRSGVVKKYAAPEVHPGSMLAGLGDGH